MTLRNVLAAFAVTLLAACPALAADNVAVTPGTGKTMACKEVTAVCYSQHMPVTSAGADMTDTTLNAQKTAEQTLFAGTATTSITRPADTTAYAADDVWADSTSAPTSGGFTLSSVCRTSGGSGIITSLTAVSSVDPTILLQAEIWIADSSVTAVNDNAAFALSDSDALKIVPGGIVPITLGHAQASAGSGTNSIYTATNVNIPYTCSGSANLRFLVKVKNAYTPASAEVLTLRVAYVGTN